MTTLLFISMPKLIFFIVVLILYLYFDFRYCTHADFREGLIVENILYWYTKVFYKVTYIRKPNKEQCGYYLTKRVWIWVLTMPISLIIKLCKHFVWEIFDYLEQLFYYNNRWIGGEEKLLTREQKNNIIKHLMK